MAKLLYKELNNDMQINQAITYVFKCLFTYSLHYLRGNKRIVSDKIPDDEFSQPYNAEYIELERAINSLSPCAREVIILYFYCGMDSTQIAKLLDKKPSTIKNTKKFALSTLRKKLGYSDEQFLESRKKNVTEIFKSTLKTKSLCYIYGVKEDTVYSIKSKQFFKHITKDL